MTRKKQFVNDVKERDWSSHWRSKRVGDYGYENASKLLFSWSHSLQVVISQALTHYYTNEFHTRQCGIYKCGGGCNVPGVGELCLKDSYCYWDMGGPIDQMDVNAPADLITKVVLEWDPMDPVVSMFKSASEFLGIELSEFEEGTKASTVGGPFGGNALSAFFNHNPFSEWDWDRDYYMYCRTTFEGITKEAATQRLVDYDLGQELLEKLKDKSNASGNALRPMCCSPGRTDDGTVQFWINTGRSTQIDGWKTREEIEAFLESDEQLVDSR